MALSASLSWEVRTTGSDANGGAFRAGSGGTDYSQQDTPQVFFGDLAIQANAAQLASGANPFTSAHVGNTINIPAAAGFTAGRYEILSVAGGIATMDRAVGTASSIGGTGRLGGAIATLPELFSARGMVASNRVYIKQGSYTISANLAYSNIGSTQPTTSTAPTAILGYSTTRGDRGIVAGADNRPVIAVASPATLGLTPNTNGWQVEGLVFDMTAAAANSTAINMTGAYNVIRSCKAIRATNLGIGIGSSGIVEGCEVDGKGTAANIGFSIGSSMLVRSYVHDVPFAFGVRLFQGASMLDCLATNCAYGIYVVTVGSTIVGCTVDGHSNHGIIASDSWISGVLIKGNLITNNGGYGLYLSGFPAQPEWDGNAYWANASGKYLPWVGSSSFGSDPYTMNLDVDLGTSAGNNPYMNRAGADYRLNSGATSGALLRGTGYTSSGVGLPQVGYRDFGVLQHQETAGSASPSTSVFFLEG